MNSTALTAIAKLKNTKRKGRRKKNDDTKVRIEISLYINGVKYEYGQICTFCGESPATFHCRECSDFYCSSCDEITHAVKKRRLHVRHKISKLTKDDASNLITYAVRFHGHLLTLQKKCRQVFKRYFDKASLNHYYYNPIYKTSSWRKPYCLRKEELFPFLTPNQAASLIQNLVFSYRARQQTISKIFLYYRRIFDRTVGKFYFAYRGKSKLIPPSSCIAPKLIGKRGYLIVIPILYTPDVAAMAIQRNWRRFLMRKYLMTLFRINLTPQWDPVKANFIYVMFDENGVERLFFENKPKVRSDD
jgi:hypothetical protein